MSKGSSSKMAKVVLPLVILLVLGLIYGLCAWAAGWQWLAGLRNFCIVVFVFMILGGFILAMWLLIKAQYEDSNEKFKDSLIAACHQGGPRGIRNIYLRGDKFNPISIKRIGRVEGFTYALFPKADIGTARAAQTGTLADSQVGSDCERYTVFCYKSAFFPLNMFMTCKLFFVRWADEHTPQHSPLMGDVYIYGISPWPLNSNKSMFTLVEDQLKLDWVRWNDEHVSRQTLHYITGKQEELVDRAMESNPDLKMELEKKRLINVNSGGGGGQQ